MDSPGACAHTPEGPFPSVARRVSVSAVERVLDEDLEAPWRHVKGAVTACTPGFYLLMAPSG